MSELSRNVYSYIQFVLLRLTCILGTLRLHSHSTCMYMCLLMADHCDMHAHSDTTEVPSEVTLLAHISSIMII